MLGATGWWTGVRLIDILKHCGVQSYKQGARHVHFNGVGKELPQGTDGSYGTSLIYGTALNPANDILIAYKHNGKLLAPDHGYPVRMIIPGGIGGRMVKWLANIEVLASESDNFYHQHDNKVLPAGIEMDQANQEGACFGCQLLNHLRVIVLFFLACVRVTAVCSFTCLDPVTCSLACRS